jgi:hypothetical protein
MFTSTLRVQIQSMSYISHNAFFVHESEVPLNQETNNNETGTFDMLCLSHIGQYFDIVH